MATSTHIQTSVRKALSEDGTDRGRQADTPSENPPRGWKDVLKRVYSNFCEHRILALAAGMTYYSLLAIFPALAALVAIYGLFADPATITRHFDEISGFFPAGAIEVAKQQLTHVASHGSHTLGWTFIIGLAVSLWSANSAMKSLFDTLNVIYGEREKRGFFSLNGVTLAFTVAAIVFALVALGAVVVVPIVLNFIGLSNIADLLVRVVRWPAMLVIAALGLAVIYCWGPSRETRCWRWVTWGSILASLLWLAASALFSWYAANFGTFNQTYGSLGAVIGFMMWLWISAIVILLGAELDAEMEHQAARDATVGASKTVNDEAAE